MRLSHRCLLFAGFFGCSAASADVPISENSPEPPRPLPLLASALTTFERTLNPAHALVDATMPNPALIENQAAYLAGGFGELQPGPGEAYVTRTLDGSPAPTPGANPRRLVRFVHMADLHVVDDESPARFGSFDLPRPTTAALRPQDPNVCQMVSAAVRTINALHHRDPIAFTLLGGDNIDNMQSNEADWVLSILDGREVKCDSGSADDPIPGPGNDGKDAFLPEGLAMPWHWVTGNHDVLVQGFMARSPDLLALAVGSEATSGTRDYSQGGALKQGDFVVPDSRRALVTRTELLRKVHDSGDGHGIGDVQLMSGKAFYYFDVPSTLLRFVILDTGSEAGGDNGMLHRADVDAYLQPILEDSRRNGKWLVLASHHTIDNLSPDGGEGGMPQADALLPSDFKALLDQYPNVLFSMNAHFHRYQVQPVMLPGGHAYWEVLTSAIADFPHGFRIVEIWDEDNGWILLRATCVDLSVEGDSVAAAGRALGVTDFTSGWNPDDGRGKLADRNVELWIRKP